jgi:hypothetical protein
LHPPAIESLAARICGWIAGRDESNIGLLLGSSLFSLICMIVWLLLYCLIIAPTLLFRPVPLVMAASEPADTFFIGQAAVCLCRWSSRSCLQPSSRRPSQSSSVFCSSSPLSSCVRWEGRRRSRLEQFPLGPRRVQGRGALPRRTRPAHRRDAIGHLHTSTWRPRAPRVVQPRYP